jgi:hypothetical protein
MEIFSTAGTQPLLSANYMSGLAEAHERILGVFTSVQGISGRKDPQSRRENQAPSSRPTHAPSSQSSRDGASSPVV